jgi:hypothetical protein
MPYCRRTSLQRGEIRRLAAIAKDGNWTLPAVGIREGRTRGGAAAPLPVEDEEEGESTDEDYSEEDESTSEDESLESSPEKKKQCNNRVILEVDQINKVIEQLACHDCGERQ